MSNVVHFRPAKARTEADPLGTVALADDLMKGAVSGEYQTIIAMVQHADGGFEVVQSGTPDVLRLLGALSFAKMDTYLECKAEAEPLE